MIGPVQVRGVSMTQDRTLVLMSLCRGGRCAIHVADQTTERLDPLLDDEAWDYRWVSAEGFTGGLAVRSRPSDEESAEPVSEIVRFRIGDAPPVVLASVPGRISSLQALGGGAYAYLVSTSLSPVEGCRDDCRYTPDAQRLVVVAGDGHVAGTLDGIVGGLEGEAFHPWREGLWLLMPWNVGRDRQLLATLSAGPEPVLVTWPDAAALAAGQTNAVTPATEAAIRRLNMIAEPFRPLGVVAVPEAVDLTAPNHAVLVQPEAGRSPTGVRVRTVSRDENGAWRADPPHDYRF